MSVKGWVYVISNAAMPGILKIGFSLKDPMLRAQELANTGSPHPYEVEYEVLIENPREVEQLAHKLLQKKLEGKKWFRCSLEEAIHSIKSVAKSPVILETKNNKNKTKSPPNTTSRHMSSGTYSGNCSFCNSHITVTIQPNSKSVRCPKCLRQSTVNGFKQKTIII